MCHSDKTIFEGAAESEKNAEPDKEHVEMMTFLLAHLTAKVSLFIYIYIQFPWLNLPKELISSLPVCLKAFPFWKPVLCILTNK